MWERARDAVEEVFDSTSFEDLLQTEQSNVEAYACSYCI
jgi:DNA-binding IscR family transcriptional regulator